MAEIKQKPKRLSKLAIASLFLIGGCCLAFFALVGLGSILPDSTPVAIATETAAAGEEALPLVSTPSPTDTPQSTPTLAPTSTPGVSPPPAVVNTPTPYIQTENNVNLRAGPGTDYNVIGILSPGQSFGIIGRNTDSSWWQIETDAGPAWVSAEVVTATHPTESIPIVEVEPPPPPPTAAPVATPLPAVPTPIPTPPTQPSLCPQGCESPQPGCEIKGNINREGEKIYHAPGWRDYNRTEIDPAKGERYFCTSQEAQANGWRAAQQ